MYIVLNTIRFNFSLALIGLYVCVLSDEMNISSAKIIKCELNYLVVVLNAFCFVLAIVF